jgi:hypothetical protein
MGRKGEPGNPPQKDQQFNRDLVGNVPHPSRTMINITNELTDAQKRSQRGNYRRDH